MREQGNKIQPKGKIALLGIMILAMGIGIHNVSAQDNTQQLERNEESVQTTTPQDSAESKSEQKDAVKLDPLKFELDPDKKDKEAKKSILQFLKFKENRERKEKERIQKAVKEMMMLNEDEKKNNKINIEPGTVNVIESELNTIKDSISDVNKEMGSVIDSIKAHKKDLDSLAKREAKRSTPVVDTDPKFDQFYELAKFTREKQGAQLQAEVLEHGIAVESIRRESDSLFIEIQNLKLCSSESYMLEESDVERIVEGDTLLRSFKKGLIPRVQMAGWHDAWGEDKSENYKFDFLTDLVYDGLKLEADGTTQKPVEMQVSPKPDVIKWAMQSGCKVLITIENPNPKEVTQFLSSPLARSTLIDELFKLWNRRIIDGVNIFFSEVSFYDRENLTLFIRELSQSLNDPNEPSTKVAKDKFQITLSLPGVLEKTSHSSKVSAYDFESLVPLVDYYWILTDQLVDQFTRVPMPSSPLESIDGRSGSIASSVEVYTTGYDIPRSKIVITISTSALEWQVNKKSNEVFPGSKAKIRSLKQILSKYKYNRDQLELFAMERYDQKQASAFIDIKERKPSLDSIYKRVWYDDVRSFKDKIDYTIEKKLGGISIRYLNFDEGDEEYNEYLQIWKVIGATNMAIDTCWISDKLFKKYDLSDYWSRFKDDLQWAGLNTLVPDQSTIRCDYEDHKKKLDDLLGTKFFSLEYFQPDKAKEFDPNARKRSLFLDNEEECLYLYVRWRIYARILLFLTLFFLLVGALIYYKGVIHLRRFPPGPKNRKWINILDGLWYLFQIFAYISFAFYIYLEPSYPVFGGGSNEQVSWTVLVVPGVLFFVFRFLYTRIYKDIKTVPID